MTLGTFRSALYRIARALGDVQAITSRKPHSIEKRLARRIVGRFMSKLMR